MILAYVWQWNAVTIILIILMVVFALTTLVVTLISRLGKKKIANQTAQMKLNASNVRIYIFNMADSTIRWFEKQNMRDQRVTTAQAFYQSFRNRTDAEKIRTWIQTYVDGNGTESSFITVPYLLAGGKECLSIYRITSYDPKRRIIHFENTLLPEISAKRSRHKDMSFIKKMIDVENAVTSNKKAKCIIYYIMLFPYSSSGSRDIKDTTRSLSVTSLYQPLNSVQKYLNKKRNLVLISDKEAAIVDSNTGYRADMISFCNLLLSEIQRYFSIKGISSLYQIDIGVAIYDGKTDFAQTVKKSEELALKASKVEGVNFLLEGDPEAENIYVEKGLTYKEIFSVISNKMFRVYFTPVLSNQLETQTYLANVIPYGIGEISFAHLMDAADKNGELASLITAVLAYIQKGLNKVNPEKFILPLPFSKAMRIGEAVDKVKGIENSLIVGLDSQQLQEYFEADMDMDKPFAIFKQDKLPLCELFKDAKIDSPQEIIGRFDMFLLDATDDKLTIHASEKKTSQLIAAYSVLNEFDKPIILEGVISPADIQVAGELGYSSFVSNAIAGPSSVFYLPDDSWKTLALPKNVDDEDEEDDDKDRDNENQEVEEEPIDYSGL
jgi:hypothetical protein